MKVNKTFSLEEINNIMAEYRNKNGKYPSYKDFDHNEELPSYHYIKLSLESYDMTFKEFVEKNNYKNKRISNRKKYFPQDYWFYIWKLKKISKILSKAVSHKKLTHYGLPTAQWLLSNYPDGKLSSYNLLLDKIGLKRNRNLTKEQVLESLNNIISKGQILYYEDFRKKKYDIGIRSINNYWGTFNNMLINLGLPLNQEDMVGKNKSFEELKEDIDRLIEYMVAQGRETITLRDISDCEWCLSSQTYHKIFKENGTTLREYLNEQGIKLQKLGSGFNYTYDDGEIVKSSYEFAFSNFLRKEKLKFKREKRYKTFIKNYKGLMDCDYVINYKDQIYYVEIAGLLRGYEKNYHQDIPITKSNSKENYRLKLKEKENMMKSAALNYLILFPSDFNNDDYKHKLQNLLNEQYIKQQNIS